MTRALLVPSSWIVVLLASLSMALCRAGIARSEGQAVQAIQTFRDCADCPEMVVVPAGKFQMGSSPEEATRDLKDAARYDKPRAVQGYLDDEQPLHPVSIDAPFALGKHLVTRGEFTAFVDGIGYSSGGGCTLWAAGEYLRQPDAGWRNPGFAQTDRDPVVCISWQEAKAYVSWLNSKVGGAREGAYRLPSEAEWEYAARAGTRTSRWWGDDIGSGNANCSGCGSRWDGKQTSPVGSFQVNQYGLSDMLGNTWEWTGDCWHETYDGAPQNGGVWTNENCTDPVLRGGDWNTRPWVLRSAARTRGSFGRPTNYRGFRVAKTL